MKKGHRNINGRRLVQWSSHIHYGYGKPWLRDVTLNEDNQCIVWP